MRRDARPATGWPGGVSPAPHSREYEQPPGDAGVSPQDFRPLARGSLSSAEPHYQISLFHTPTQGLLFRRMLKGAGRS